MLTTAYAAGATDKQVILTAYTAATGEPYTAGAHNTSGLSLRYRRAGANSVVTITPVSQTENGAHTDGGFVHLGGGRYRLDLPDAAIATGADYVVIWAFGVSGVVFTSATVDILSGDPRDDTVAVDAASVRSAIGLASANLDTQLADVPTVAEFNARTLAAADYATASALATVAGYLDTEIASILDTATRIEADTQDLQARVPAALVGGRMDANVGAMAANVVTAAAVAADAVTEIQSGLATAAALATVDTEVGALQATADRIEADTQDLQAQVGVDGAGLTAIGDTRLANLDATVSSRSTLSAADVNAQADQALADYDAPTKAELDAAVAPLSTAAALAAVASAVTAIDAIVDAIQAKTDLLPTNPAAVGDIPTAVQNADALLGRSIAGGANGGRTVTSALRRIRNRLAIAAGTLTVYQENDTTVDHTAAVTTAAGNPITEIDPA
jgi:hypothetical protein